MSNIYESIERVAGSSKATRIAWVSAGPDFLGGYLLCVNPKEKRAEPFRSLHLHHFNNYSAAQSIANAIRARVARSRS